MKMRNSIVASFAVYAFVVICTTSAVSLRSDKDLDAPPNCDYGIYYREGEIPDPFNCHQFYICAPAEGGITVALNMTCPENLYFSFRTCRCEFDTSGCCLNCSNAEFFNCTKIYEPALQDEESPEAIIAG